LRPYNWSQGELHGGLTGGAAQVNFPVAGEWRIDVLAELSDGSTVLGDSLELTVKKDFGKIGWPNDRSWRNHTTADTQDPVGLSLTTGRAPLLGEEMPVEITLQSTEDVDLAQFSFTFTKMGDNRLEPVPPDKVVVEGDGSWEGSLKKGEPVTFARLLKFPSEGDWWINFFTKGKYRKSMVALAIHVGTQESRFSWTVNHDLKDDNRKPGDNATSENATLAN
jgi:hypothetical protein